jgi:hypothetical protein
VRSCLAAIVVATGLALGGCSSYWQMGEAGVSPARDAACCVALASQIGLNLQVHETDQFLVLSSADDPSAIATGQLLDQVYLRFYEQFSRAGFGPKPPPDKLVWVCVNSYGALEAYGRAADGADVSWMGAYYSHETNRVAAAMAAGRPVAQAQVRGRPSGSSGKIAALGDPGGGPPAGGGLNIRTLTHELTHQLAFNSGLQRRGATYPFWLTEGLATNFEADSVDSVGLGREESRYRQRLIEAKAGGRLIALERLAAMTDCPAGPASATRDAYAQAWGFFHYLMESRPGALKKYMADLSPAWLPRQNAESLRSRFIAVFGPVKPLEEDFLRFIDRPGAAGGSR